MLRRACLLCLTASLTCSGYETKWFTQSLTHVPSDTRTFRQRYFVETHGNNAVLFYAGNEGPIRTKKQYVREVVGLRRVVSDGSVLLSAARPQARAASTTTPIPHA